MQIHLSGNISQETHIFHKTTCTCFYLYLQSFCAEVNVLFCRLCFVRHVSGSFVQVHLSQHQDSLPYLSQDTAQCLVISIELLQSPVHWSHYAGSHIPPTDLKHGSPRVKYRQ